MKQFKALFLLTILILVNACEPVSSPNRWTQVNQSDADSVSFELVGEPSNAVSGEEYHFYFSNEGFKTPVNVELKALPAGSDIDWMNAQVIGGAVLLSGIPEETGDFSWQITVTLQDGDTYGDTFHVSVE